MHHRIVAAACALLATASLSMGCQDKQTSSWSHSAHDGAAQDIAYIRIPQRFLTPAFVTKIGFNRDHVRDDVFAFGYLKRDVLLSLPHDVFAEVVELDAKAWSKKRFDPKTLEILDDQSHSLQQRRAGENYHDYDALTDELQAIAARFPKISSLESAGQSVEGRELWVLKISDNAAADEAEPKLLYIANMHGDEVVGRELMIYFIRQLTSEYETNPRIKHLVDNAQIYIMPSMNPDGFERHQRHNAHGIDLNRDFPDFTSDPYDDIRGRAPETVAVMRLHDQHHFVLALNFHGGEVCFNMPWDTTTNRSMGEKFGDDLFLQQAARLYADSNQTMRANNGGFFDRGVTYGYEWYEVDGGMQDWHNFYRQGIHATIELSYTKWPAANRLPTMWDENKEALLAYLEHALRGIHVRTIDPQGLEISSPRISLDSARRTVQYRSQTINRPTLSGLQKVTVSADGFQSISFDMEPWVFAGDFHELVLSPDSAR